VAEVRPWLSLLEYRRNSRIFQNKTSIEIITTIFREHNGTFKNKTTGSLPRRPFCVQYDETDLAFLSAYYAALRGRLENRLLFGHRRRDKFDKA